MSAPARAILAAAVAVLVVVSGYEIFALSSPQTPVAGPVPSSFTVNGKTYAFSFTATTQAEREAGLMNTRVTGSTTMLFAFPSYGRWSFWMYDTNTSLDMIWLNATGSTAAVVFLVSGAPPCFDSSNCPIYTPASPANYVIEAKSGFAADNGIAVGSVIKLI